MTQFPHPFFPSYDVLLADNKSNPYCVRRSGYVIKNFLLGCARVCRQLVRTGSLLICKLLS